MDQWLKFGDLIAVAWVRFLVKEPHHLSGGCYTVLAVCCVMLKAVPLVFQIPGKSPTVDKFQQSFQTRKKDLATHL